MCGITGGIAYFGNTLVDENEIQDMTDAIRRRGPDSSGCWISKDRRVGLGNRRLAIIDLSDSGRQPMKHPSRELWVTFNGEIYNYPELRGHLQSRGVQLRTTCDTEALLHLYDLYSDDIVHYLSGMYAFAIWDDAKQRLFLARDPNGIKPLYWSDDGRVFRFASEIRALDSIGKSSLSPSAVSLVGFFSLGYIPEPHTLFDKVSALQAGHTLVVDRNGIQRPSRFFSPRALLASYEEVYRSWAPTDGEIIERISQSLSTSVSRHFMSDVPIVIFLSSGIDSTALTAHAKSTHANINTLTLRVAEYLNQPEDESLLAQDTANALSTNHNVSHIDKEDFDNSLEEILTAMDQPSVDGVNTWFVSRAAAQAGFKVAMSGLGADELFAGYPSFHDVPNLVQMFQWFPVGFSKRFRIVTKTLISKFTSPKYASIFELGTDFPSAYFLRRGLFMPWELPDILDPDIVKAGWRDLALVDHLGEACAGVANSRSRITLLETQWYMRNQLLRDTDWASMWHSLEIRVPFIDSRLFVELAPLLTCGRPPMKHHLVDGLSASLPSKLRARKKTGFLVPVNKWLYQTLQEKNLPEERGLRGWAKYIVRQKLENRTVH